MTGRRSLVFFDASVLVAAARSPLGGSAVSLEVCRRGQFRGAVTARVLLEARVNISEKFGESEVLRFYRQMAALDPEMVPPPCQKRPAECVPPTTDKDAHVLAAAMDCGTAYLLTLDRRHLLTPAVREAVKSPDVITPGDFLRQALLARPEDTPAT